VIIKNREIMGKRSKKSKIVSGETTELYDKITKTET
jgi:hypothetical protein